MYYKVTNFYMKSRIISKDVPEFAIQYGLGIWTYPHPKTKLFVFGTISEAQSFKHGFGGRLFECEVINPSEDDSLFNIKPMYRVAEWLKSKVQKLRIKKIENARWPIGTVCCDGVKLTKEIL